MNNPRTHYDAFYLAAFLRNPVECTLSLDYGWRPIGGDPRWVFGHLRAWAEVELRRCAQRGYTRDTALNHVFNVMMNGDGLPAQQYRELCRTAPLTRFVMQPVALERAIVAYADWCYEALAEEAGAGTIVLEHQWTRDWVPAIGRNRWLCGNLDVIRDARDTLGRRVTIVDELKATSKAADTELITQYRNSLQSRLYAWALAQDNLTISYSIWSIGGRGQGYVPTFIPSTEFDVTQGYVAETQMALRRIAGMVAAWESQEFFWAEDFGSGVPTPWLDTPYAAWGDPWRKLWVLPHGERAAYIRDHFEKREPWRPLAVRN